MSRVRSLRPFLVLTIMLASAAAALAMRPDRPLARAPSSFVLEQAVPRQFGQWHLDPDSHLELPSPELEAAVARAYEQTMDRSYVDDRGRRVMLSIAFSGDYDKGMQWHRPENCYPSQGFTIDAPTVPVALTTPQGTIAAARLVARRGERIEPITYWFVLGGRQARFGLDLRLHQILDGISGRVPDGLLVRVSSIDSEVSQAFATQSNFAAELMASIEPADRHRFLGIETIARAQ
jgi:EpsI family protein